jgi:hypothetical protein
LQPILQKQGVRILNITFFRNNFHNGKIIPEEHKFQSFNPGNKALTDKRAEAGISMEIE